MIVTISGNSAANISSKETRTERGNCPLFLLVLVEDTDLGAGNKFVEDIVCIVEFSLDERAVRAV
jgi:hypothetical protein